ncbi:hypothetical protein J612_2464, partial [Acinetobacter baumannii 1471012]
KGTTYEAGINRACQARADQMGWAPKNNPQQVQQQQSLHH